MADKAVKWTLRAINDKLAIYEYWNNRNKSTAYSNKLEKLFNEAAKLLSQHPIAGPQTNYKNIRVKNLRDYQLFYQVLGDSVVVIAVWDSRRNPKKLNIG